MEEIQSPVVGAHYSRERKCGQNSFPQLRAITFQDQKACRRRLAIRIRLKPVDDFCGLGMAFTDTLYVDRETDRP
jgi:hypothetical protein